MAITINASPTNGLQMASDGSGVVKLQSNGVTTNALAWVNFNGMSGSVAIRTQYNISSVTRNSAGNYTLAFTNALSDANYCVGGFSEGASGFNGLSVYASGGGGTAPTLKTTTQVQLEAGGFDVYAGMVIVFGN